MDRLAPLTAVCPKRWLSLLQGDVQGSVRLHPELVATLPSPPLIFHCVGHCVGEHAAEPHADDPLRGLAVLEPRPLPLVRRVGTRVALRGHRVLDDRLLGAAADPAVVASFVDTVRGLLADGGSDVVFFEDLDVASPLAGALDHAARAGALDLERPRGAQPHWWIDFPEEPSTYWARFSAKTRNSFKRKMNKLPHEVVRVRDEGDVDAFVREAREVSARSWQGQRLGERFPSHVHGELRALARLGALRAYLLRHEGKAVAFFVGVQTAGRFVVEELGYDVALRDRGPGTVLMCRVLEDLIAHDTPRSVDFGAGHADYKALFGTRETKSGPVWIVARRPRPRALVWLARAAREVESQVAGMVKARGAYQWLRRMYRGGLGGVLPIVTVESGELLSLVATVA